VNLRWSWSPQARETLVLYRSGSPPTGPEDGEAQRDIVSESDYSRLGQYSIHLPIDESGPWHVVVYGLAGASDHPITSPGIEPSARTIVPGSHPVVTVSYSIRRHLLGLAGRSVTIWTDPSDEPVPPLVLVVNARTPPVTADDGATIAHFPASGDGARFLLPRWVKLSGLRARLFVDPLEEPEENRPIRIVHPGVEESRV
jgi:hypothetical protein